MQNPADTIPVLSAPTESTAPATSDAQLLDLLRRRGGMSVSEVAEAMGVTATAVRQRLTRLMDQQLIERRVAAVLDGDTEARAGRGRPSHRYSLTEKARRQSGNNFTDLAVVLWDEIRAVKDQEVRRGLLERIASAMAAMYRDRVTGATLAARLESLKELFGERRVPLDFSDDRSDDESPGPAVETSVARSQLPLLTVNECPYPELAAKDRGICAVEKMLFAKLLEQPVRLTQCRLDGHDCCQFQTN
ncbi:MAG TPA: MarR family transcriptional regulator [Pirellulales bacterium]|jgi:predicted ArsR family transcriptional regulator